MSMDLLVGSRSDGFVRRAKPSSRVIIDGVPREAPCGLVMVSDGDPSRILVSVGLEVSRLARLFGSHFVRPSAFPPGFVVGSVGVPRLAMGRRMSGHRDIVSRRLRASGIELHRRVPFICGPASAFRASVTAARWVPALDISFDSRVEFLSPSWFVGPPSPRVASVVVLRASAFAFRAVVPFAGLPLVMARRCYRLSRLRRICGCRIGP